MKSPALSACLTLLSAKNPFLVGLNPTDASALLVEVVGEKAAELVQVTEAIISGFYPGAWRPTWEIGHDSLGIRAELDFSRFSMSGNLEWALRKAAELHGGGVLTNGRCDHVTIRWAA